MNREELNRKVNRAIAGLDDPVEAAQIAIDITLSHLLDFVQETSAELIVSHLYSETLASGMIHQHIRKLKRGT